MDNDATPYVLVDSTHPQVEIPPGIEKDGQVVLNIAARAVQGLAMENTHIAFSARFSGKAQNIYIPIQAVMAIYSMEDGEGMMFADNSSSPEHADRDEDKASGDNKKPTKPGLKIVK